MNENVNETADVRESLVTASPSSPCVLVHGTGRRKGGYAVARVAGKPVSLHRLAYEWSHGPIPDGHVVMHVCDNPSCINPSHLRAGTQRENIADREAKGRGRVPVRARGSWTGKIRSSR
jgi:hypothetical protein